MKNITYILIFFVLSACKPEKISQNEVISDLMVSDIAPLADGNTVIDLSVNINSGADADKRNIIFRASSAGFLPGSDTIITQKAVFENGFLVARVKYKVPSSDKSIVFTAQPESRSPQQDFVLKRTITSLVSLPTTLTLSPSAPGVLPGYAGEILVTGTLKNGSRNASANLKVVFEDYFPDGTPVQGRYRLKKETSDANASVSTFYSPGNVAPGRSFYIKCTYLSADNKKTNIKDSCLVTVIQP